MRVLVMGGSQFNGYSLVMELVKCGHEVTVLNRGRTAVDFPRSVRRLVADRTDHDQVRAVLGGDGFADDPAAAAGPPGAGPRRRHHGGPGGPCGRPVPGAADDDAPAPDQSLDLDFTFEDQIAAHVRRGG